MGREAWINMSVTDVPDEYGDAIIQSLPCDMALLPTKGNVIDAYRCPFNESTAMLRQYRSHQLNTIRIKDELECETKLSDSWIERVWLLIAVFDLVDVFGLARSV